jgi:hypothetical protein
VAIFGNLTEFPFPEIASMLDRRVGILKFANVRSYTRLELHLNQGQIQGLQVDGTVVQDGFKVKAYVMELFNETQGNFIFEKVRVESLRHDFSNPLVGMLLQSSAVKDEYEHYRDQLPDVATRFTIITQEAASLEDTLRDFWFRAQPCLLRGSSAQELAQALGMQASQVQLFLYKLRLAGLIRPARRIAENTSNTAPVAPRTPSLVVPHKPTPAPSSAPKQGLVSRLLGALRLLRSAS